MLAKFFHRSEPISFVFMMIWLGFLVFVQTARNSEYQFDLQYYITSIGILIFFVVLMFYFDFLIQRFKLSINNYFAHFFFLVLIGFFDGVLNLNVSNISFGFVMLAIGSVMNLRNKELPNIKLFNSGLFLGIAYLFFPPSFLFLLVIYIGYFIYIKIIDKRLLIPLIGFITPILLVFTYFYLTNQIKVFRNWTEISITTGFNWLNNYYISIPILIYGLILLLLTVKYISISSFSELEEERNYKIIIAFLFVSILVVLLNGKAIEYQILWTFFPAIFLIGNSVQKIKREWLKEGIFYLSLIFSLLIFIL